MLKFTQKTTFLVFMLMMIQGSQRLNYTTTNFQFLPCDLTVMATAMPQIICEPGNIDLAVTANNNIVKVEWAPAAIVDDANSAITSATVNATTTFEVTLTSLDDENLIINGDFSNGISDFTSDYIMGTGGSSGLLTNEGQFAIATNAATTHTAFAACTDPSNNGGNILVVNGAGILNQNVWCQTININANTDYSFGFSLTSVISSNPAQLQISINNDLLNNTFTAASSTCNWTEFAEIWFSAAAISAEICIVNQNTASGGNDFAIDDLVFTEVCTAIDQITVTVEELAAEWTAPLDLCPNATDIILDNLLSNTTTLGGIWTINGQETAIFSPQISGTGAFFTTYTVSTATCTENISHFIVVNALPNVSWENPSPLSINAVDITLDELLDNDVLSGGTWNIAGNAANIFSASTLGAGAYEVLYTVGNAPCENALMQIITVEQGGCDAAEVMLTPVPTICLSGGEMPFDLIATVIGDPGVSLWSGTGITNVQNGTFDPQIAGPGIHPIIHTYVTIDCNVIDSMAIEIIEQPIASFIAMDTICISDTLAIIFDGTASPQAVYNWNFFDANIISGSDEGPYELQWDTASIHLVQLSVTDGDCFTNPVFANIQVDAVLDTPIIECFTTFSTISYEWNPIENATAYVVSVINGPLGIITSDTSYLLPDLVPGQTVGIRMVVISDNSCPGSINLPICTSTYCPDSVDIIIPFGPICIGEGIIDTIQLAYNIPDSLNEFTSTMWSGMGVTDSMLIIDESMLGMNEIYLFLEHDVCAVFDTFRYEVISGPIVDFELPDSICLTDTIDIIFTGTTTINTTFTWDIGGGVLANAGDGDTLQVFWESDSIKNISLELAAPGCGTETLIQQIDVQPPLTIPVLNCEASLAEVLFTWQVDSLVTSFDINIIQGLAGILTSDTSYLIQNLAPEQEIEIEITFISSNACENTSASILCSTLPCPDIVLNINPVPSICFEQMDTLQLAFTSNIDLDSTLLTWTGPGIIDNITGLFLIDSSRIGQSNQVILFYGEGDCLISDTISIAILAQSTAFFTLADSICIGDTTSVIFTGSATESAVFNWNLDGGLLVSLNNTDSLQVYWADGGTKNITLQLIDNECGTTELTQEIEIQTPLETPIISCESTLSSILFTWPANPLATGVQVNVLQGSTGTLMADTGYLVQNLLPEEEIEIEVIFISPNTCQNSVDTLLCSTLPCPDVSLTIEPVLSICFTQIDTLQLELASSMGIDTGLLYWSGVGIIDSINGLFLLDTSRVGQNNEIIIFYEEGVCQFSDTIFIDIQQQATAFFALTDSLCLGDTTSISYTGNASENAIFNWSFENANIASANGIGPHEISWAIDGNFEVMLTVEENSCVSETIVDTLTIMPPLTVSIPTCEVSLSSIGLSWPAVSGANGYELNIAENFTINWLSDTSIIINDLIPDTTLHFTLVALSNPNCGNPEISFTCTTEFCSNITFNWTAETETICLGEQIFINYSIPSNDTFDITLVSGIDTNFFTNITDGSSLLIAPTESTTYSIINITNENSIFCTPALPEIINITVNEPLEAGEALPAMDICSGDDNLITLSSLITGFQSGGIWAETSSFPTPLGAFDNLVGSLNTLAVPAGTYHFDYTLSSPPPCPEDKVELTIIIHPTPIADAGEDLILDCLFNEGSIGSPNTSTGGDFEILWSSQNGTTIDNSTQAIIEVNESDTYLLTLTDTITGCSQNDEVVVTTDTSFLIPYTSLSNLSCFGMDDGSIQIDSITGGAPPYLISFDGGELSNQMVFNSLSAGNYHLFIIDSKGCQTELNLDLSAPNQLIVEIISTIASEEQIIQQGEELILNALINRAEAEIDTIIWTPSTLMGESPLQIIDYPLVTSTYSITVTDKLGCTASDFLTIYVNKERNVFIPNSFSPNDDGINDLFQIFTGQGIVSIISFNIFNRWGELVYTQTDFQANAALGWDGKFNGKALNPAVFVYVAEIEMVDGEVVTFKGEVTLVR